jgi:hypothetical protein
MSKVVSVIARMVPDIQLTKINQNPDEDYRRIWSSDPLTLKSGITAGTANELLKMAKSSLSGMRTVQTKMTCLQSVRDTQVNAAMNIDLFSKHPLRSIVKFNNSWHAILLEQDKDAACNVILDIITQ